MERKKLTKKERTFNADVENGKNIIAYDNVKVYAASDIPIPEKTNTEIVGLETPDDIWKGFNPDEEPLDEVLVSSEGNRSVYTFRATRREDGDLIVQTDVFAPTYASRKAVILINERDRVAQKEIIDAAISSGSYVFCVDYNGIFPDTLTSFPPSLSYGKHGDEGNRLRSVIPSAKDSCPYLYTLILRRALSFIYKLFSFSDVIATGIRNGTELAMQLSGTERDRISALACVGDGGYPEYSSYPRYPDGVVPLDNETLAFIVSASGVSYLKNYPRPLFVAVGSNGTTSDIDRLSALKDLISGTLTVSIAQKCTDNVDMRSFKVFSDWLNQAFWKSSFPSPPVSTIEVNKDGTVYATITAPTHPKLKSLCLFYSYNNADHRTRSWQKVVCETIGDGQYLAKLKFDAQVSHLFFYTEATYLNGLICTENPKYANLANYRVFLSGPRNPALLFRHDDDGNKFVPLSEDVIVSSESIKETAVPSGVKGTVCESGGMTLFVGDDCKIVPSTKLLQADVYCSAPLSALELGVTVGERAIQYRATKKIAPVNTFCSLKFSCTDFKDELFRPLAGWAQTVSISVISPNVVVNKLTFI